jgi:ADP-heptose:LPS heptosyltransferase
MILKMDAKRQMDAEKQYKILIVRLSSFGDIIQAMSSLIPLKNNFPSSQIHWLARSDMAPLLGMTDLIDRAWSYDRRLGLMGLIKLGFILRQEGFTHIFDAHSNLRSFILKLLLFSPKIHIVTRSKERIRRFLLFQCRINTFEQPYRGLVSFLKPLERWSIHGKPQQLKLQFDSEEVTKVKELKASKKISIVPSAAWEMKRWPLEHWKNLVKALPEYEFIILGGPGDDFCQEIKDVSPERITNTAGNLSLKESCLVVQESLLVISADTGLLHVADITGTPCLALIGPTAFGFPTHPNVKVLEIPLVCRPCTKDGRGRCIQKVYQQCLVDISPLEVAREVRSLIPV